MPKVLLHNHTFRFRDRSPDGFYHDQKAVFSTVPGDIVVTRKKIDGVLLAFLENVGFDFRGVEFIHSDKLLEEFDSIFADEKIIKEVGRVVGGKEYMLDVYVPTFYEKEFSQKLGMPLEGNPDHYFRWGTKSGFRKLAKKLLIPIPRGAEDLASPKELHGALKWLFGEGAEAVIIKIDEGLLGRGMLRFDKRYFLSPLFNPDKCFQDVFLRGPIALKSHALVVEEWIENTALSPSVQIFIDHTGGVRVSSFHSQLLGPKGVGYRGVLSGEAIPEKFRKELAVHGGKIASFLSSQGFRGWLGLDAVVTQGGQIVFTELNARKVSALYPYWIAEKLFGRAERVFYQATHYKSSRLVETDAKYFFDLIKSLLYSPVSQRGVVPFNLGRLSGEGFFEAVIFGNSFEEIDDLRKKVVAYIN